MKIFESVSDWTTYRDNALADFQSKAPQNGFGFVPTMGALHHGHFSLVQKSLAENPKTVVSIFVNQTQFNKSEDYKNYPQTLSEDISALSSLGVDALLTPKYEDLYPDGFRYQVDEDLFSKELCGKNRPGHFKGVLTVVMKLLNLTKAKRAYFGEKDYQQFLLIKEMTEAFFMDVEIIPCPTTRDNRGLALSSRNLRLSQSEKILAQKINGLLRDPKMDLKSIESQLTQWGIDLDYLEEHLGRRFVAANIGPVRLIDNAAL